MRSNSHQVGGSTGGRFIEGGAGGGHRASVPNTALVGRGEYQGRPLPPPSQQRTQRENGSTTDNSIDEASGAYGSSTGSRVVPSLFPRSTMAVPGSPGRFGQGSGIGSMVPLSPGSKGPSRPITQTPPTDPGSPRRSTPSGSEKHAGIVGADLELELDTDPGQQSRWNHLLVRHPHARRASIGNLAPSGMVGRRPGGSGSDEEEEEEDEKGKEGDDPADKAGSSGRKRRSGRDIGNGLRRESSLREKGSVPSSPTRASPPVEDALKDVSTTTTTTTTKTTTTGLRTVTSTEGSSTRRSRRPQTSSGALTGTQTRGGLSSRASGRGQLGLAGSENGHGGRNGSISPGTVVEEDTQDSTRLEGRLSPAAEVTESVAPLRSSARPAPTRGQSNLTSVGWGHLSSSSGLVSPPADSAGQAEFLGKRSRGTGTGRPGWEGEEVVGVLREDGMPVTTFRSTTQMSRHLRNQSAVEEAAKTAAGASDDAPTVSNTVSTFASPLCRVLLVPLSDSPTLPSLSLLLAQGTTPSAICFQQDLLDRARRTEADWLPSALNMIETATRRGSEAALPAEALHKERCIHVIAYSANPALAPSVVDECLRAGAIGVLQPPYDNDVTLKKIRKMIKWAERSHQVRGSYDASEVSGNEQEEAQRSNEAFIREEEQILEDAAAVPSLVPDEAGHADSGVQDPDQPTEAELNSDPAKTLYSRLAAYDFSSRRRSVDNGGLSLALERAQTAAKQHRFKSTPDIHHLSATPTPPTKQDRSSSLAGLEGYLVAKQEEKPQETATVVAELLGEMYRQTRISIEIQMIDYAE